MDRIALMADTNNTRARRAAADLIDRYAFVAEASADVGPRRPTDRPAPHPTARRQRPPKAHQPTGHQRGLTSPLHLTVPRVGADRAAADHQEVADVCQVIVRQRPDRSMTLQFDRTHTLEGRILAEQFR